MEKKLEENSAVGPAQNADHPQSSTPGNSKMIVAGLLLMLTGEAIKEQNK